MNIGELQRKLSLWAAQDEGRKFYGLYALVCREDWLRLAYEHVKQNAGSKTAGCDGVNMSEWEADLIPTVRDRIVQEALRMILEPIYEADFSQYSFGFRPNRCTLDAIKCVLWTITEQKKFFWVIEGDISSYFDTINHRKLLRLLGRRVDDERFLGLVWKFLRAGVMERKLFRDTKRGTPQGGIISPLLANVYLHELDKYMEKYTVLSQQEKATRRKRGLANYAYVRYADDFLILSNGSRAQADETREGVRDFLFADLRLTLSMEKTKVTHLNDGFDFLGFKIRRSMGSKGMTTRSSSPGRGWKSTLMRSRRPPPRKPMRTR